MLSFTPAQVPVQRLESLYKIHTSVDVLRLDLVHPIVSGNKWFKLRYYLEEAARKNMGQLLTWGGAYSNHIVATAAAAKELGFITTGIIRGEEPADYSPTLQEAKTFGMELVFLSRQAYKEKSIPPKLEARLHEGSCLEIPEGGYGLKGALGAATILDGINKEHYTHIITATGTGSTAAGLLRSALPSQKVISIPVLKNEGSIESEIRTLLPEEYSNLEVLNRFHRGGYARWDTALIEFMNDWYNRTGIPSDFVYTAKMFAAVDQLLSEGYFPGDSRLLLIHTGGLQGNRSLPKGTLIF